MRWLRSCVLLQCVCLTESPALVENSEVIRLQSITPSSAAAVNGSGDYESTEMKAATEEYKSGLEGTTYLKIISGVPGGRSSGQPASTEFAVAPVEDNKPNYRRSIFVRSDERGNFKISLPPGQYWLGPKAKALDPVNYIPPSSSVSEEFVIVEQGTFTRIDVFQVGYAP